MVKRVQTTYTRGRRNTIAVMGDSLSHNITLGVPMHRFWAEVLAGRLRDLQSCGVRARNFAISGNTTTSMLARIHEMVRYDIPVIAIIFGGVNDPGSGISSATTTANIQAMIKYLKNGCAPIPGVGTAAYVAGQASLPAAGTEGTRYVVLSDTSSTGGLNPSGYTGDHVTLTGTHSGPQVWECRNSAAGETGWSRVSTLSSPIVSKFILVSPQFLNFTSPGDTVDAGGTHSGQNASYNAVLNAVSTAATNEGSGTVFADLYLYMQARINAGKDSALSGSWHVTGTNQHLNTYGNDLIASFIYSTIVAQSGWITALA